MFFFRPWTLGKILGIPIRIDPGWILIFLLLTYQLAVFVFPAELGLGRRRGLNADLLALGALASLLLFASVLAHELAHAVVARARGVPVLGITLFIFGGVAQIGDEPDSPATEFWIAVVGPLMSLALALAAGAVWVWAQALQGLGLFRGTPFLLPSIYIATIAFYLAQANLLLALFNLLPGFPLDGGRVLRAAIWGVLHDQRRATFWGMVSGRVLALALLGGGAWLVLHGQFSGSWLFLMAWFLWRAAGEAYHALLARELLKGITVGALMRAPVARVSENLSLAELAMSFATSSLREPALAVDLSGRPVGLIGVAQVRQVPRAKWTATRVRQAMLPFAPSQVVAPNQAALAALAMLGDQEDVPVVQDGQVIGSIGRNELSRYLHAQGE